MITIGKISDTIIPTIETRSKDNGSIKEKEVPFNRNKADSDPKIHTKINKYILVRSVLRRPENKYNDFICTPNKQILRMLEGDLDSGKNNTIHNLLP